MQRFSGKGGSLHLPWVLQCSVILRSLLVGEAYSFASIIVELGSGYAAFFWQRR
jgi:hypothetical protein